jgi:hypothetical protein
MIAAWGIADLVGVGSGGSGAFSQCEAVDFTIAIAPQTGLVGEVLGRHVGRQTLGELGANCRLRPMGAESWCSTKAAWSSVAATRSCSMPASTYARLALASTFEPNRRQGWTVASRAGLEAMSGLNLTLNRKTPPIKLIKNI